MTVPGPSTQLAVLERARAHAAHVLGPQTAKRLAMFHNGVLYVNPGGWARFLAWLVDVVVSVLGMAVGVIVAAVVDLAADLDNGTGTLIVLIRRRLVRAVRGTRCRRVLGVRSR